MQTSLKMQAALAATTIRPFLSAAQLAVMGDACRGEERDFFMKKFIELAEQISTMPKTYEQDGKGDAAVAHLHYFSGGSDWYITEKDMDGGIRQAFGYAVLNGDDDCAELGYISIQELTRMGIELDLHFTPCTLAAIKAKRAGQDVAHNPNPWVVVSNPGMDDEDIVNDFPAFSDARKCADEFGENADVMKRRDDGTLTSEY